MAEFIYTGNLQYTLRASGPMPVYAGGSNIPTDYVLHSFGADLSNFDIYECTEDLLSSSEFNGQGGSLLSASFSSVGDRDGKVFQGRATYYPSFINEQYGGFNSPPANVCVGD